MNITDNLKHHVRALATLLEQDEFGCASWHGAVGHKMRSVYGGIKASGIIDDVEIVHVNSPGVRLGAIANQMNQPGAPTWHDVNIAADQGIASATELLVTWCTLVLECVEVKP
jgi:hypothetical protein